MSGSDVEGVPRWLRTGAALSWRLLVVVAAAVLLGAAFSRLRVIMVPLIAALFLATILAPPANWLHRRRWPRLLASWTVFLVAAGLIAVFVIGVLPTARSEFATLGVDIQLGLQRTDTWLIKGPLHLSAKQVNSFTVGLTRTVKSNQAGLLRGALSGVTVAAEIAAGVLLTLVLTFFMVNDGGKIFAWMVSAMGSESRSQQLVQLGNDLWRTVTGYVRGTAFNGAVNATALSITLIVLGVPLVLPIAVLTVIGSFIPLVGGIVSGLLAALVTLVTKGPLDALVVVGATILIHNMEGYLTGPLILGRAVRLHPMAILLVLAAGSILGGIVGAFIAVPLASVLVTLVSALRRSRLVVPGPDGARPVPPPNGTGIQMPGTAGPE
ncbi:MAG: AI-2E family transporter [Actinomycetota bacterium]|nr:AI-2E family transporter [Actinomycetota bacterium]